MRRTRLLAVLVGVVATVAVLAPGAGSKTAAPQVCKVEYTSGVEVVFQRFKTHPPAVTFRNKVVGNGFQNASIIEGCDGFFRVVVRGAETYDVAVDLQAEAKTVNYATTIECVKGKDDVGELEVVFGHPRTRAEAADLVSRAAASGFVGLLLEPDPCGGFEVMLQGFQDQNETDDFVREATAHGFDVVIEKS
ncbi:MAG: hypothetical protein WAQ33_06680 [Gaiellaceae bacterium]